MILVVFIMSNKNTKKWESQHWQPFIYENKLSCYNGGYFSQRSIINKIGLILVDIFLLKKKYMDKKDQALISII